MSLAAIRLCDYASLGLSGTHFATWFPLVQPAGARPLPADIPFSRTNPTRTVFVDSFTSPVSLQTDEACNSASRRRRRVKLTIVDGRGQPIRIHRFACDAVHSLASFSREIGSFLGDLSCRSRLEYATTRADQWQSLVSEEDWKSCVSSTSYRDLLRVRCIVVET